MGRLDSRRGHLADEGRGGGFLFAALGNGQTHTAYASDSGVVIVEQIKGSQIPAMHLWCYGLADGRCAAINKLITAPYVTRWKQYM